MNTYVKALKPHVHTNLAKLIDSFVWTKEESYNKKQEILAQQHHEREESIRNYYVNETRIAQRSAKYRRKALGNSLPPARKKKKCFRVCVDYHWKKYTREEYANIKKNMIYIDGSEGYRSW